MPNIIDLLIIIILLLFTFKGLGNPFFLEIIDLISFLVSFFLSLKFYNLVASQFETLFSLPHSLANVFGFIAVWYLSEAVFLIFSRFVYPLGVLFNFPGNKILSVIPAFFKGVIFIAILLILTGTFPIQPSLKNAVHSSKLGSLILSNAYSVESPLKSVFGDISSDTLTFMTIKPNTNERINTGFKNNDFNFDEKIEFSMIDLVNKERESRNIPPLIFDSNLRQIARDQSADMFKNGYFAHIDSKGEDVAGRAKNAGISFMVIGENLAFAPTLDLAHQGLMNSPGHKANILSEDFHKIGIGIASSSDYGIMVTQVFKN